jgi:hypothetical protein
LRSSSVIGRFFCTVSFPPRTTKGSLEPDGYHLGVLLKATWVDGEGCVITATDNNLLAITIIYSMVFDFIVLFLTGWKLAFPAGGKSHLVTLIFGDGLIFFIIA